MTANQAFKRITSNLGPNGALPFTVALNATMNVTPIYLNVSRGAIPPPCPPDELPAWEAAVIVILFTSVGLAIGIVATLIVICLVKYFRRRRAINLPTATYEKQTDEIEIES